MEGKRREGNGKGGEGKGREGEGRGRGLVGPKGNRVSHAHRKMTQ